MSIEQELILSILIFTKLVVFILLVIFACGYALPLCLLPRFHSPINIMTVHLCFTFISSALFWIIVYTLDFHYNAGSGIITQHQCSILSSIETILNCLLIYSLCGVTINRYCIINYANKVIFKTQKWALVCVGITWLITLVVSLPLLILSNNGTCFQIYDKIFFPGIYTLLIVIIFPTIIFVIMNILIFTYTRRSTRRIQANTASRRILLNNRDIRLLKHMIIMFAVFLSGWAPIYVFICIDVDGKALPIVYRSLSILPALSLVANIIDLFLFNHQLRTYFRQLVGFRNPRVQRIITRQ